MVTERFISVIIPVHNGSATIGRCLDAVFASRYANFEVVVVDDCSTDGSADIIRQYPCRLIRLDAHAGASAARNAGARNAAGGYLFFIDADCVPREDTLARVNEALGGDEAAAVGGTYTLLPYDAGFFSAFQSAFVHWSETRSGKPDYLATHALALRAALFRAGGGFSEDFLPILEDVEFSHRLRERGVRLVMDPGIQVRHIFNFTLLKSLRNAYRKSRYWTVYSLRARDLFADSGTASHGLKANGASWLASCALLLLGLASGRLLFLAPVPFLAGWNAYVNRGLFAAFMRAGGISFAVPAALYYLTLYPAAVLAGAGRGLMNVLGASLRTQGARA